MSEEFINFKDTTSYLQVLQSSLRSLREKTGNVGIIITDVHIVCNPQDTEIIEGLKRNVFAIASFFGFGRAEIVLAQEIPLGKIHFTTLCTHRASGIPMFN